jgi:hypothetical protein
MLSKYTPNRYTGSDAQYIRDVHLRQHDEAVVHRGRLNQLSARYYCVETLLGNKQNILSATTIAHQIDYDTLPESHPYHHGHDASGHHPSDWPLIRWYSRKRGILFHNLVLDDDGEDITGRAEDLVTTPPEDHTHEDVQEAVSSWKHTPRVPHPDEDHAYTTAEEALVSHMRDEANQAANEWDRLTLNHDIRSIADEQLVVGETDDGHPYGGQADRIATIHDGPVKEGLYVVELKLARDTHPRHLIQAEAHRRALADDLPGISAAVVQLDVAADDYELITSHDDRWDEDELWSLFCRRTASLYDDGLYQVALANAGR